MHDRKNQQRFWNDTFFFFLLYVDMLYVTVSDKKNTILSIVDFKKL